MIRQPLASSFSVAAVFLLCPLSTAVAQETRAVVAYSSINPNSSQLEIARAQGFYRKYGLDPEIILVRSSATATAGLASGNIQFGFIGGSALLNAAAEGLPLGMLTSFDAQLTYDLIARPEIKSINDLKGKKFGVGSLGGTPWMAAKLAFEYLGLDEKRDRIKVVSMSNQTSRYHALDQGSIDAAILQGNFSRALKGKGFSVIADLEQAKIPFVGAGVVLHYVRPRGGGDTVNNSRGQGVQDERFILGEVVKIERCAGGRLGDRGHPVCAVTAAGPQHTEHANRHGPAPFVFGCHDSSSFRPKLLHPFGLTPEMAREKMTIRSRHCCFLKNHFGVKKEPLSPSATLFMLCFVSESSSCLGPTRHLPPFARSSR